MPNELKPGYMLKNRYRIDKKIGEGGFSVLYMARDMGDPGKLGERIEKLLVVKESRDEIDKITYVWNRNVLEVEIYTSSGNYSMRMGSVFNKFLVYAEKRGVNVEEIKITNEQV